MRFKYFLRGLGTGIVFTTLIMLSAYLMSDKSISDNEIKSRASKLGMVMASESDAYIMNLKDDSDGDLTIENTTEETTENPADKLTEENTTELIVEPIVEETKGNTVDDKASTEAVTEDTTTEVTTEEITEADTTENPSKVTELTFKVSAGMTSEDVSKILESNGIVDDYKKFNNYLMNKGYANRIRANSKKVNSNMTYEELAKVLVK